MKGKKKAAVDPTLEPLSGLEVKSLGKLLASASKRLEPIVGPGLVWTKPDDVSHDEVHYLNGQKRPVNALSRNRLVPVLPLITDGLGVVRNWLAIAVGSSKNSRGTNTTFLTHASIQVFEGEASESLKTLLFRAEWNPTQATGVDHGQPHWHFHREVGSDAVPLDAPLQRLSDSAKPVTDNIYRRLHFPMAARFHEGTERCVVILSEDHFRAWLPSTVAYLRDELRALHKLVSLNVRAPVPEQATKKRRAKTKGRVT